MDQVLSWLGAVDWLEVIRSLAPLVTAAIAYFALRNWRRQDKAKREAEFLDDLVEATHAYVIEMRTPIELLNGAKIGMDCHVENWREGNGEEKALHGAIAYIEKRGEKDGKRLAEALVSVEPSVIKLRTLSAKGQIFKFRDYRKCQDAVSLLTWHFDRLVSFTSITSSTSWNWENPEVRGMLTKVIAVRPDEVRKGIGESNAAILEFAQASYKSLYG